MRPFRTGPGGPFERVCVCVCVCVCVRPPPSSPPPTHTPDKSFILGPARRRVSVAARDVTRAGPGLYGNETGLF